MVNVRNYYKVTYVIHNLVSDLPRSEIFVDLSA